MVEKLKLTNIDIWFGQVRALKGLSMEVIENEILSVIGPSNSGKTSFLRALNRLNDIEDRCRMSGNIIMDGREINRATRP